MGTIAMRLRWAVTVLGLGLTACGVSPVVSNQEESQANRVVLALDKAKITAEKEADPANEGRYRVVVGADDATRALEALREEELPQTRPANLLEATAASGSLIPSAVAEQAALIVGLQGELERTLESVPGVLDARVHLNVPRQDALSPFAAKAKASGSVLLEHVGATPPISEGDVTQLVSRAVADLAPTDVAIVMISRPASPTAPLPSQQLAHVLSIAVAPGSVRIVYGILASAALLVMAFAGVTWRLLLRVRQLEATTAETNDG
jgi:type III secretion protein J